MAETLLTPPPIKMDNRTRGRSVPDVQPEPPEQDVSPPSDRLRRGSIVDWFIEKDTRYPAIVLHINPNGTLRLAIFNGQPVLDVSRVAVHHISETIQTDENIQRRQYGFWDFPQTPQ